MMKARSRSSWRCKSCIRPSPDPRPQQAFRNRRWTRSGGQGTPFRDTRPPEPGPRQPPCLKMRPDSSSCSARAAAHQCVRGVEGVVGDGRARSTLAAARLSQCRGRSVGWQGSCAGAGVTGATPLPGVCSRHDCALSQWRGEGAGLLGHEGRGDGQAGGGEEDGGEGHGFEHGWFLPCETAIGLRFERRQATCLGEKNTVLRRPRAGTKPHEKSEVFTLDGHALPADSADPHARPGFFDKAVRGGL